MEQRISLITLGVRDMDRAAKFYEDLGWQRVDSPDGVIAFDLLDQTLGLFPLEKLAEDIGLPVDDLGRGAITLAHNLRSATQVDTLLTAAVKAGGKMLKPSQKAIWGGYHGYFADPEGHIWEIAHNPGALLSETGAFRWNGFG